jgi:hypothetical protein
VERHCHRMGAAIALGDASLAATCFCFATFII